MSPLECYNKFISEFPEAKTETICDWGDFYTCTKYPDGGFINEVWKISKNQQKISVFSIEDSTNELRKRDDNFYPTEYKVKDLLEKTS